MNNSRIDDLTLLSKVMSAEDAAKLIDSGSTVGMSRFTGSGYPKAVPMSLADRIEAAHRAGDSFRVRVWTGASTGPELDGALAKSSASTFGSRTTPILSRERRSIAVRWSIWICI